MRLYFSAVGRAYRFGTYFRLIRFLRFTVIIHRYNRFGIYAFGQIVKRIHFRRYAIACVYGILIPARGYAFFREQKQLPFFNARARF